MKKLFIVFSLVAAFALSSCGGSTKTEDKVETAEKAGDTLLSDYKDFTKKSLELAKKMQEGDASVAADLTKLQEDAVKFQTAIAALSPEEQAKFAKAAQDIVAEFTVVIAE